MNTKIKWTLALVPLAGMLGGILLTSACRNDPSAKAASSGKDAAKEVRVVRAQRGALPRVVTVTGTLAAEEQVVLGMKVSGRLMEFSVDLGSRVTKGQAMARLDPTDFKLRVEQAEAALQQARSRLGLTPVYTEAAGRSAGTDDRVDPEQTSLVRQARAVLDEARLKRDRARKLYQEQLVPQSELDAAEANFAVAESRYQDAMEEVRKDRKSTRLNSSHIQKSRMPSSA